MSLSFGVCPRNAVSALETAPRNITLTVRLNFQKRLPLVVKELIESEICFLRSHISAEKAGDVRFAGCTAVVHDVPPGDTHHGREAEPETVEVAGDDGLDHFSALAFAGRSNGDFAQADRDTE